MKKKTAKRAVFIVNENKRDECMVVAKNIEDAIQLYKCRWGASYCVYNVAKKGDCIVETSSVLDLKIADNEMD